MTIGAMNDRSHGAMPAADACDATDRLSPHGSLPGTDQTGEAIERWLRREAVAGAIVVVRHRQRGLCEYHLDAVARINTPARRVHLAHHGAFDFDGAGVAGARGQLTLLEPRPDVLDAAIHGRTWQQGRPAFTRPLSSDELCLIGQLEERRG